MLSSIHSVLLLSIFAGVWGSGVDILSPDPSKNGTLDVALIIVPGADINGPAYRPLGEAIQKAFPGRMWVALLKDFLLNTPNPLQLGGAISNARSKLKSSGFHGDNVFLAGHSLGGVFVGSYGLSHASQFKGVMLFASYLTRSHRLRDYPVPVLTISGDLDGLTRITRIVDTYEELQNETIHNTSPISLIYSRPVIVLRGLNHGHFASGEMPSNVKSHDIQADPDITYDMAHQQIAFNVVNFVIATLGEPVEERLTAFAGLKAAYFQTGDIIQPLSQMKAMDVNNNDRSNTTEQGQLAILGQGLASHVLVKDEEISSTMLPAYEPEVSLSGGKAYIQTFSSVVIPFDPEDVSEFPQTPSEIVAVMKTKQALSLMFPNVSSDNETGTCRQINQHVLAMAENAASNTAKQRATTRKAPKMTLHDDNEHSTIAMWTTSSLELNYGSNGELEVTSQVYRTNTAEDVLMDKSSGNIYCKLLSPYRAMEWFYLDSLKRQS